jgi:transcriptional regulator with XRE-family HTH domain
VGRFFVYQSGGRMSKIISLAEQVELLFTHGRERGQPVTYRVVAEATGETANNLFRIRRGQNTNPGLRTLAALVEYFNTDLGYFSCKTKEDCLHYLNRPS